MQQEAPERSRPLGSSAAAQQLPHWRPSLSVGNADLDEQHIVLLEMGRNLLDSLEDVPAALDRVVGELGDLLSASREHDSAEERILAANGCPTLDAHQLSHTITRLRLQVLLDDARRGQVDAAALRHALMGWMQHHIGEFDLPVKAYLANPGRGHATVQHRPPARAPQPYLRA